MLKALKMVFGMVVLLMFIVPVFAQTVDTGWVRTYDGPGNSNDRATAIAVDNSGNVCVTGGSYAIGAYDDYATIKYLPSGDTAWVRRYNVSNSYDDANAIAIDNSGNIYVTGGSIGIASGLDYATIKYLPSGDTAWVRRYDGLGNNWDKAAAIAVDDSGKVYVTGNSYGIGSDYDYATVKYLPSGDTAWVRRYNGPGNGEDDAYALVVDNSGNVYVTGRSVDSVTGYDYATIKYLPNGDTAWVRRYDGTGNSSDNATAIVVDASGNVYVTGSSFNTMFNTDYATIKYLPNGDTAWVRRYDGPTSGSDYAKDIAVDDSGFVYVTGYSDSTGSYQDYATIKYDSDGNEVWVRRYNGPPGNGSDFAYAIAIDGSSNVYVTGSSGGGSTDMDYATIKYHSNGDTAWVMRYNGPGNGSDGANGIAVDDSGNVYVTGYCTGSATSYDYCTIKYVQKPSDVKDETGSKEKPFEFALSQNYPNPFNPSTTIRYTVRRPPTAVRSPVPTTQDRAVDGSQFTVHSPILTTLKIYNILGEKVRTLVDEPKWAGNYSVQWDGKNDKGEQLSSGIYFYQLKVGDYASSKKMMLLK